MNEVGAKARPTFHNVQYLRFFAAFAVVLFHTGYELKGALGEMFEAANLAALAAGVDVFFVISGFIMYATWRGGERSPARFLLKRIIRVVPLYWLGTAIVGLAAVSDLLPWIELSWANVLRSLLFVPHYSAEDPGGIYPLLVPGWTLNYEMFFYGLFCLAMLAARNVLVPLSGALLGLFAIGQIVETDNPLFLTWTSPLIVEFLFGLGLGWLWTSGRAFAPSPALCALALGAALACQLIWAEAARASPLLRLLVWGGPAAVIVACALAMEGRVRRYPRFIRLGDASYAIYIFHLIVIWGLVAVRERLPVDTAAPLWQIAFQTLCIGASVWTGLWIHGRLERPVTGLLRRRFLDARAGRSGFQSSLRAEGRLRAGDGVSGCGPQTVRSVPRRA